MKAFDQRMRRKEFGQAAPQCAGAMAVNHADLRLAGQRGAIDEFVHPPRGLFDRAANHVDLIARGAGFAICGSHMHCDATA